MGKNQALVRRRWPHAAGRTAPEAGQQQPSNVTGTSGRVATGEIARGGLDGSTRPRDDVKRERSSKTRARIREGLLEEQSRDGRRASTEREALSSRGKSACKRGQKVGRVREERRAERRSLWWRGGQDAAELVSDGVGGSPREGWHLTRLRVGICVVARMQRSPPMSVCSLQRHNRPV